MLQPQKEVRDISRRDDDQIAFRAEVRARFDVEIVDDDRTKTPPNPLIWAATRPGLSRRFAISTVKFFDSDR